MKNVFLIFVLSLLLISTPLSSVFAGSDTEQVMKEINKLKSKIYNLERQLAQKAPAPVEVQKSRSTVDKLNKALGDISINIGATGIIQGATGNDDGDNPIDGSYSVDVEFEAPIGKNGRAYMHLEAGDGENVVSEVGGLTGTNADAAYLDDDMGVSEIWYEHNFSFMNCGMQLNVGKIDVTRFFDTNTVADDETTQFLANIFVDNITMELPDGDIYAPGARLMISPCPLVDVSVGIFDGNDDYEDIFDDLFSILEVAVKPKFFGLQGNYRIYGWHNNKDHIEVGTVTVQGPWPWSPPTETFGISDDDEENYGFGISIDQVVNEPTGLSVFFRYGYQNDDIFAVNPEEFNGLADLLDGTNIAIEHTFSAGFSITGKCWNRPEDVFAMAAGVAILKDVYEDTASNLGIDTEDEYRFETYYKYKINDKLYISPDFQYVTNLYGLDNDDDIFIFGVRTQLYF